MCLLLRSNQLETSNQQMRFDQQSEYLSSWKQKALDLNSLYWPYTSPMFQCIPVINYLKVDMITPNCIDLTMIAAQEGVRQIL